MLQNNGYSKKHELECEEAYLFFYQFTMTMLNMSGSK